MRVRRSQSLSAQKGVQRLAAKLKFMFSGLVRQTTYTLLRHTTKSKCAKAPRHEILNICEINAALLRAPKLSKIYIFIL